MDVDDMFDLMKTLDGAQPAAANKKTVDKQNKDIVRNKNLPDHKVIREVMPKSFKSQQKQDNQNYGKNKTEGFSHNTIDVTSRPKANCSKGNNMSAHKNQKMRKNVDNMFAMMDTLENLKASSSSERQEEVKHEELHINKNVEIKQMKYVFNEESLESGELFTNKYEFNVMNLSRLQELCSEDIAMAVITLVDRKSGFLDIFHKQNLQTEVIFCIMNLLGKLCSSEDLKFNERILSPACNPTFLQTLQECIGSIPVENKLEIKTQIGRFFDDLLAFVNTVTVLLPMTVSNRMRNVLLSAQITVNHIQEHDVDVNLSEHLYFEIKSLKDQLDSMNVNYDMTTGKSEHANTRSFNSKDGRNRPTVVVNVKPPDNFRFISVYPTEKDLFSNESFLRENIVTGSYADVNHYLDVQFRLYKEDFISPLRAGVQEYIKTSTSLDQKKRINNIRFYPSVHFLRSIVRGSDLNYNIQFSNTKLKNIVGMNSKRLMFGSLLMFSDDNYKTFFLATVSGRDLRQLKQGILTVKLIASSNIPCNLFSQQFVMLESEVFFEPYFQVLTVLRQIDNYNFPMEEYIIHAKSESNIPGQTSSKSVKKPVNHRFYLSIGNKRFNVFNDDSWPRHVELCLDSSQYKAFKAALTRKFSVIQGPPGTGKTYIGLKIARALLNKHYEPMLVICYTNHALDQFLEGLLPFTRRLVRLGSQSKSSHLKEFNITKIRKKVIRQNKINKENLSKKERQSYYHSDQAIAQRNYFFEKENLNETVYKIQMLEAQVKLLETNILSTAYFEQQFSRKHQKMLSDKILVDWLMEEYINLEESDYKDVEEQELPLRKEIEEEDCFSGDQLSSTDSDVEEADESDTDVSSSDSYVTTGEELTDSDFEEYYVRKRLNRRPIKHAQKPNYGCFLENENNGFVELTFKDDLNYIDSLISRCSDAKETLNTVKCNKNLKKVQCIRYEMIEEIDMQKRYLDSDETEKLSSLSLEDLKEEIDDELENILKSVRNKIMIEIQRKEKYLAEKLSSDPVIDMEVVENFKNCSDVWIISPNDRWMLYHYWKNMYRQKLMHSLSGWHRDYDYQYKYLKISSQNLDVEFLRNMEVIGLTTTCAARLRPLLEKLGCKIVIVEEAAEVFEAHIVTALTKDCEQVILIGDHEQLRPNPSTYRLAKKYNLDISLFERMIRNGMCCYSLEVQHRMRPEIVSLIVPAIYKKLDNHETVLNRPVIKGLANNVYFVAHNYYEDTVSDSASKRNTHEADFLIALCMYLLHQGYPPEKITILTTYTGQMYYMKDVVKKQVLRSLHSVNITVVDNYQGEENDIILLSLVRSNKDARIGFLATKNKICVSLSRARNGLFIIGNMDNLVEQSTVWQDIRDQLRTQNAISPALPLRCSVHVHHITRVSCAADFRQMHNGGCTLPCNFELKCGHICPELCHVHNREHKYDPVSYTRTFRCNEIVEQMLLCGHERKIPCYLATDDRSKCDVLIEHNLECGHIVLLLCQENISKYKCKELVNVILPCGHETMLPCAFSDPDGYKCTEIVPHILELCGHIINKCCWVDKVDPWLCQEFCDMELPCGHECGEVCHQYNDPDHLKVKCMNKCTRKRKYCSLDHKCRKLCYESCEPCYENVQKTLACGHMVDLKCEDDILKVFCEIKSEKTLPCGHTDTVCCGTDVEKYFCHTVCTKVLPCGHEMELQCSEDVTKAKCKKSCLRTLTCGHQCQLLCSKPCVCYVVVTNDLPECGHRQVLPCHKFIKNSNLCKELCSRDRACGHHCAGLCGEPCELLKCLEPCTKVLACSHRCAGGCWENCELRKCQEPCTRLLECGHPCTGKCGDPCDLVKCDVDVVKDATTDCGHGKVLVKCSLFTKVSDTPSPYLMMYFCNEPCNAQLPCGHVCVGTCGACMQGDLHTPCDQKCNNKLICGHVCDAMCKELCLPCRQPCVYSCQHRRCQKKCGDPCTRCQMKCDWQCPHARCTNLCSEMCNREPCNKHCSNILACGHLCMGFCGEVCPKLCRQCDNLDYSEDERLVVLEDCGHTVKSTVLEEMFHVTEKSIISVKACPECECIISKTKRYRNAVKFNCKLIKCVRDNVISNLRELNAKCLRQTKEDNNGKDICFADTAEYFSQYLSNPYVIRNKYAASFLSLLVGELSVTFTLVGVDRTLQGSKLYDSLVGLTLGSSSQAIFDYKNILLRADCLVDKMYQRMNWMSIYDMRQFLFGIIHLQNTILTTTLPDVCYQMKASLSNRIDEVKDEMSVLNKLINNLNLSANSWSLCHSGHINNKEIGLSCAKCESDEKRKKFFKTSALVKHCFIEGSI